MQITIIKFKRENNGQLTNRLISAVRITTFIGY